MSRQSDLEKKYGKILFEDAIDAFLKDYGIETPLVDDQARSELSDMFEYYGVDRLSKGFDKLESASQMYFVGAIIHRFAATLPEGAGFAELSMENSEYDCFLVKKGAGYENEVKALRDASEE